MPPRAGRIRALGERLLAIRILGVLYRCLRAREIVFRRLFLFYDFVMTVLCSLVMLTALANTITGFTLLNTADRK